MGYYVRCASGIENGNKPLVKLSQPALKNIVVQLDPEFDHVRAMPDVTQVTIHSPDQRVTAMPQFTAHSEEAHRRPAVERLQTRGTVGVRQHVGPDLAPGP